MNIVEYLIGKPKEKMYYLASHNVNYLNLEE
jgi:hypothetical protein